MKTVLHGEHLRLGARAIEFSGWDMPVHYPEGILAEHHQTRTQAALFDTCHMGEFLIEGPGAPAFLDGMITSGPSDLPLGRCRYGLMLNEKGGVVDDCIAYRRGPERYLLVVNAGTRIGDFAHLKSHLVPDVRLEDASDRTGKLDLQGPESLDALDRALGINARALPYFGFLERQDWIVSRTGYTGERGVELYLPVEQTVGVWRRLLEDAAVKPAGLGARDTLRTECGLSLYGHELAADVPVSACGVDRFLRSKAGFLGKKALERERAAGGPALKAAGLMSDSKSAPRAGEIVLLNGEPVGQITSGCLSPCLERGIALARLRAGLEGKIGLELAVDKGRRALPVRIAELPFYKQGTARAG